MQNTTVRTVVAFGLIALILGGAAIGGVRLMKARNSSYAQPAAVAANNKQPDDNAKGSAAPTNNSSPSQSSSSSASSTSTGQTAVPTSLPAPSTSSTPVTTSATTPATVPNTSGMGDSMPVFALMMLSAFFGGRLLRARASFRRYVASR